MYDFRSLSPLDFEELVRDLLQEALGIQLESFGAGKDQGIDFRYSKGAASVVVQAKHYIESSGATLLKAAAIEDKKVASLKPSRYIFATSQSMTPLKKQKIIEAMPSCQIKPSGVYGKEDLNNLIGMYPKVERKHFKLWLASTEVLTRILHGGLLSRAEAELGIIRNLVPKLVHNESVNEAEAILESKGALIISGDPGVGKTTLARILVWLHAEQGWEIYVIDDMKDFFEAASAEGKRLILFDDFLGQIRLSDSSIHNVDKRFSTAVEKVAGNRSLRFIMTTRDYILHQAQAQSEKLSGKEVDSLSFTLNVGKYTRAARAKIVFNHIFFSDLSSDHRSRLVEGGFYMRIIDHPNFNPRLIETVLSAEYVSLAGESIQSSIIKVLTNPEILWEKPYRAHISIEGRALMLSLFILGAPLPISVIQRTFVRISKLLGVPVNSVELPVKFRSALKELEGSVVSIKARTAQFANPGLMDFMAGAVIKDQQTTYLIDAVEELHEIESLWQFYSAKKLEIGSSDDISIRWNSSVRRLLSSSGERPVRMLKLVLAFDAVFGPEKHGTLFDILVENVEQQGIDEDDLEAASRLLTIIKSSGFRMTSKRKAIEAISFFALVPFKSLVAHMNLYEVEAIAGALISYGSELNSTRQIVRDAICHHLDDLESRLDDCVDLSDVDSYESDLRSLMETYEIEADGSFDLSFWNRRDAINERYDEEDVEKLGSYSPNHFSSQIAITDSEIRSIFGELERDARSQAASQLTGAKDRGEF